MNTGQVPQRPASNLFSSVYGRVTCFLVFQAQARSPQSPLGVLPPAQHRNRSGAGIGPRHLGIGQHEAAQEEEKPGVLWEAGFGARD